MNEYERQIEAYRARQREARNAALRARLARPRTREEMFKALGALSLTYGQAREKVPQMR